MAAPDDTGPDNLTLRLLREMRDEIRALRADRGADMRAMGDVLAATRRTHEGVNRALDRLDEVRAELVAFRHDTDRNFRRLEADIATAEGRIWDRQAEAIDQAAFLKVMADRLAAVEAVILPSA